MVSRRSLLAAIASTGGAGYLVQTNADAKRAVDGVVDTLAGEEWDARDAAEAAHVRINDLRAELGRDKLAFDPELAEIATSYARRMADEGFYGHEDPSGDGFKQRYADANYRCDAEGYAGAENILQTHWQETITDDDGEPKYMGTPQTVGTAVANGWWDSPEHRENILLEAWDDEGIGFAKDDENRVYAVQNFC